MPKIKLRGIIYSQQAFGDSSLIFRCFSREHGRIGILAKGLRTKPKASVPLIPAEYDLWCHEPQDDGLWLLAEHDMLRDLSVYPDSSTWIAAICGIELSAMIVAPPYDLNALYDLLISYLDYLAGIPRNAILLLWRYWLRIYISSGIGNPFASCCICHQALHEHSRFCEAEAGFLCTVCAADGSVSGEMKAVSPQAAQLIKLLPEIGNHLHEITLNKAVVNEINNYLSQYWFAHTKQTLKLKSLSVLVQFY